MTKRRIASVLVAVLAAACTDVRNATMPFEPTVQQAIGTDPVTGATIQTDLDDYSPGQMVHVTGSGWAASEVVNLLLTENPDTHADVSMNVTASPTGTFNVDLYHVQEHDLGVTFTLTARGQTSGSQAVAVFTDGNFGMRTAAGSPSFTGMIIKYNASTVCTGTPADTTDTPLVTTTTGPGAGINTGDSARLIAPASLPGWTFSHWTVSGAVTLKAGTALTDASICVEGTVPGLTGARTFTAHYTAVPTNTAPTVNAGADATINEGAPGLSQNGSFTDPDANTWSATVNYGDGPDQALALSGKTFTLSHVYADNGIYQVVVIVSDGTTQDADTIQVTVNNVDPTATFSNDGPVNEGSPFELELSNVVDPGTADTHTFAFDCGDGAGYGAASATATASCATTDNGTRNVKGKVIDDDGGFTEYSATVTINNVRPIIDVVTLPTGPLQIGSNVTVSWTFTDPGADSWQCKISWDQPVAYGPLFASSGKTCTATSNSLPAGVYTVTVYVIDDDGGYDERTETAYIVVYDPSGGFVTGGGWIMSPAGAYMLDTSLAGKATFGFVSKYVKGKTTPQGNTEFQFHAGNLNFKSTSYEWLVVAGTRAQYKGEGTIENMPGTFGFLLTAIDGGNTSGGVNPDKFRIKIWNKATSAVIYDNQMGQLEDSPAATSLSGGSIVIHAK